MTADVDPGRRSVVHVVTGLGRGGAERTLATVVPRLAARGWSSAVVALGEDGPFAGVLADAGIEVVALGMSAGRSTPGGFATLVRTVRGIRPSIVQGWMYHGNLGATLAGAAVGAPVVWNVRQSLGAPETERPGTEIVLRLGAHVSARAFRIVYNSVRAARQHESIGYRAAGRVVVPNGFDTRLFRPDPEARARIRRDLGLAGDAPVAGCVARVHPVKDHAGLLAAFARVRRERPDARLILVGRGTDRLPDGLAARAGARGGVLALGERDDLPAVLAALDVAVLGSRAEAFPNALGEAMACGVPCVATDVGDVESLVGETGWVVPPGDPGRLAGAWLEAIAEPPEATRARSLAARRRIETCFDLDTAVEAYDRLYSAALDRRPA